MCFDPRKDGRAIWETIHLLAANAETPQQRSAFIQFIINLPVLYPCKKCRLHTAQFLDKNPISNYTESSQLLLYWTWIFHDSVNQKLNKPLAQRFTWEQTRQKYMSECDDVYRIENNHPMVRANVSSKNEGQPPSCGECEVEDEETENNYSIPIYSVPSKEKIKPRIYLYDNE